MLEIPRSLIFIDKKVVPRDRQRGAAKANSVRYIYIRLCIYMIIFMPSHLIYCKMLNFTKRKCLLERKLLFLVMWWAGLCLLLSPFFLFFLYLLLVSLEQRRQKDNEVLCQCVCVGLGVCVCILLLFLAQLPRINLLIFFVLRFWDNRQPTCRMRNLIKYTTWKRTASPL